MELKGLVFGASALSLLLIGFYANSNKRPDGDDFDAGVKHHQYVIVQANQVFGFDLVDPEQAPPEIYQSVMHGYQLINGTPYYAPEYVKNQLSCTNCHFCAGDTTGGENNGISLVGVTTTYPRFSKRDNKVIAIEDRISNCFRRSMNGIAPKKDSQDIKDIVAYLEWISKEVVHIKDIPWLGIKFVKNDHKPDEKNGEYLYNKYCASCHKEDGQGGGLLPEPEGKTIPPLWGPNSFNDGAGMGRMDMFTGFVYWNMPYQNAFLTEEQAIDVAAYVLKQPRPQFNENQ